MAAHKKSGKKTPEEFWSKVLAAPKVKRILEKRGFDTEAFRRDYEADTSRGPRLPKRPSRAQLDAVEAFQQNGDFEALKKALSTESSAVGSPSTKNGLKCPFFPGCRLSAKRAFRLASVVTHAFSRLSRRPSILPG